MSLSILSGSLAWVSVFALSWLLLLRIIPSNLGTWAFFVFFVVIAFISGYVHTYSPKEGVLDVNKLQK